MEENKYKYLVNVSNLVRLVRYSINTGCCPDDSTHYIVTVRSKDSDVWEAFHKMRMREDNDILFCISTQVERVLILVDVDRFFDNIHHTFDLDFIGTEYSLDSEFAKGLKRINSLDDIEKSHSDEPGERGEQGVGPAVLLNIIEELDLCTPLVIQPGGRAIAEVCCNKKLADFHRKYDSCRVIFRVDIGDDVGYYVVEHEGEVVIDSFTWILKEINYKEIPLMYCSGQLYKSPLQVERDGDNVSFSVPTLAGPRGSQPEDSIISKEKKEKLRLLRELIEENERWWEQRQSGMLTYKREDAPKFPQMRRARLNKPKSI